MRMFRPYRYSLSAIRERSVNSRPWPLSHPALCGRGRIRFLHIQFDGSKSAEHSCDKRAAPAKKAMKPS